MSPAVTDRRDEVQKRMLADRVTSQSEVLPILQTFLQVVHKPSKYLFLLIFINRPNLQPERLSEDTTRLRIVNKDVILENIKMSGFQFPPPPPPPPKVSSTADGAHLGQRGGHDRGRGRGRGRGMYGERTSGNRSGPYNNLADNQYSKPGHPNFPPALISGASQSGASSSSNNPSNISRHFPSNIPPGSHVNPLFLANVKNTNPLQQRSFGSGNATPTLPRTAAGHKRKLDILRGSPPQSAKKPGPPIAPSVPSFGSAIVPSVQVIHPTANTSLPKEVPSKKSSNIFGLFPKDEDPQYSSSESDGDDEGVDEEAMYAELGTTLTFEHNGTVVSLGSPADLAAWRNERKMNWPSKNRLALKAEEKRRLGDKRKTLISDALAILSKPRFRHSQQHVQHTPTNQTPSLDVHAHKEDGHAVEVDGFGHAENVGVAQAETSKDHTTVGVVDARSHDLQVPASKYANGQTEDTIDITPGHRVDSTNHRSSKNEDGSMKADVDGTEQDETRKSIDLGIAASTTSEGSPQSSTGQFDDDGPPEEKASKPTPTSNAFERPVCKYFAASGRCRDGESCRYRHENAPALPGALHTTVQNKNKPDFTPRHPASLFQAESKATKSSIFSLLMDKEQDDSDRLALQVIRSLGDCGFFAPSDQSISQEAEADKV